MFLYVYKSGAKLHIFYDIYNSLTLFFCVVVQKSRNCSSFVFSKNEDEGKKYRKRKHSKGTKKWKQIQIIFPFCLHKSNKSTTFVAERNAHNYETIRRIYLFSSNSYV